ncbi:MAG: hypothetical protein JW798_10060 [Prolixibacteraceae bacterium]|nr:hypothetical protein [Prolixibacteraceae bacterium]
MNKFIQTAILFATGVLIAHIQADADVLVNTGKLFENPVNINNHIWVFEDSTGTICLNEIVKDKSSFQPLSEYKPQNQVSTYWFNFSIKSLEKKHSHLVFFYRNLTYVELYEFRNNELFKLHTSGLFRPKSKITPGDEPGNIRIAIEEGDSIDVWVKVNHVKGYIPIFNFYIQNEISYLKDNKQSDNIDFLIFGGLIFFLLYSIINSLVSRYKPFGWLALFIFGSAFYGFSMAGHMIPFFMEYPELTWRLNPFFANISGIGGFLLMNSYFDLRKNNKRLSVVLFFMIGILILQIIVSQFILQFTSNYQLMTRINLLTLFIFIPVAVYSPVSVWKKLSQPQKMLSWVVFIYSSALFLSFFILWFFKEEANPNMVWLANLVALLVIIFFTISLGEQLRGVEVERNQALSQLSKIKEDQNKILEELVEKRTNELMELNEELEVQKEALSRRNERIELLLKELHHRVKNNLQLFSSFYELSAHSPKEKNLEKIIEEGQSRIRVMALVHDMLYHGNLINSIDIERYLSQISIYIQSFLKTEKALYVSINCNNLFFDLDTALPLGLMVNELLTNTLKYCITENKVIDVTILVEPRKDHGYQLILTDNGEKIEKDFSQAVSQNFGMKMISLLSKQLNGSFRYVYEKRNTFIIEFNDYESLKQIP